MNGTSVPFTISIQCQSGIQTVWKTFYTCANLPTYLELLSVSTAWSNKGYCFSPLPPLDGMQATLCQASLALIVQIESHTTVRGKFLEQIGTTEALPGSWTWTCQFRVYNNNADIEQFIKVIWYTVYCSLCTQLNEKLTHWLVAQSSCPNV